MYLHLRCSWQKWPQSVWSWIKKLCNLFSFLCIFIEHKNFWQNAKSKRFPSSRSRHSVFTPETEDRRVPHVADGYWDGESAECVCVFLSNPGKKTNYPASSPCKRWARWDNKNGDVLNLTDRSDSKRPIECISVINVVGWMNSRNGTSTPEGKLSYKSKNCFHISTFVVVFLAWSWTKQEAQRLFYVFPCRISVEMVQMTETLFSKWHFRALWSKNIVWETGQVTPHKSSIQYRKLESFFRVRAVIISYFTHFRPTNSPLSGMFDTVTLPGMSKSNLQMLPLFLSDVLGE